MCVSLLIAVIAAQSGRLLGDWLDSWAGAQGILGSGVHATAAQSDVSLQDATRPSAATRVGLDQQASAWLRSCSYAKLS